MDLVVYILVGVLVVVFGVMAMRQNKENRGKSYEQKREELWEYSQRRVNEEFKQTTEGASDTSEGE